eukprot:222781_1
MALMIIGAPCHLYCQAARDSRQRRKLRVEDQKHSVLQLQQENNTIREQNELLRQIINTDIPSECAQIIQTYFQENAQLRLVLHNLMEEWEGIPAIRNTTANGAPVESLQNSTS